MLTSASAAAMRCAARRWHCVERAGRHAERRRARRPWRMIEQGGSDRAGPSGRSTSDSVSTDAAMPADRVDGLLPMLARFLPQIVDALTPQGWPTGPGRCSTAQPGSAGDVGGMLGVRARSWRIARWPQGARRTVGCPCDARPRSAAAGPGSAPSGHGHVARHRPHPPLPRAGAGRLAVHRPPRRRPAPRPDLVLVGRRGAPRLLQAGRPEGPQPAREPVGDARPRRRRGRLRHRAGRGPGRAARPPDRRGPAGRRTSRSTRDQLAAHRPRRRPTTPRPTRRSSGSSRTTSSAGTAGRCRTAPGWPGRRSPRSRAAARRRRRRRGRADGRRPPGRADAADRPAGRVRPSSCDGSARRSAGPARPDRRVRPASGAAAGSL